MTVAAPATPIQACLDRLAAGGPAARRELLQLSRDRLLAVLRGQLERFPRLRRWVQSEDVLHDAYQKLDRAVARVGPATTEHFLAVAARTFRWALTDLIRKHFGAEGVGANHHTPGADGRGALDLDAADPARGPAALAELHEVVERVDRLPPVEREVVDLVYYHGLSHAAAGRVLGVCDRTVRRRLTAAEIRLGRPA